MRKSLLTAKTIHNFSQVYNNKVINDMKRNKKKKKKVKMTLSVAKRQNKRCGVLQEI